MEMNLTYSNWTAPALEYLNFATNCTLVGQFAHTWYSGEQGINDRVGAAYFEAALPPDLKGKVTAGQLLDWSQAAYASAWNHSYSNGSNVYIEFVLNRPQAACPKDFCRGIPYQGIPDLLGVGILISYYIQTAFCSVYTIVICWDFWIRKHEKSNGKIVQRIVDAFKTSLGVFTDAAMIFAIAINVAALCSTRNADSSIVEVSLAEEAAFFASITVVLLDTLNDFAYDNAKRKKERTAVIVVFTVLYIITNYATQYAYPKSDWPTWEDYCSINVMYGQALATTILKDVLFGCFWLWVLIIYFFPWVSKKCLPRVANWLIKWRPASKIGCLVISVILVWALLIDMTVTRQLLLEWSGTDTSDVEWSFGQVIALMTWLPILIELGYLIKELEGSLQDRVPDGWLVVKRTDDIEANPAGDTDEAEEVNKQKDAPEVDGRSEDEIELLPQGSHSRNVSNSSTSDAGIRRKEKIERTYIQRRSGSNNSNPERLPRNSTI